MPGHLSLGNKGPAYGSFECETLDNHSFFLYVNETFNKTFLAFMAEGRKISQYGNCSLFKVFL